MDASRLIFHSEHEIIAIKHESRESKNSCETCKIGSLLQRRTSRSRLPMIPTGIPRNSISRNDWKNGSPPRVPLSTAHEPSSEVARRDSASDVLSPSRYKSPRHFVSNKVVLELRSNLQSGRKSSCSTGDEIACDFLIGCDAKPDVPAPCQRQSAKSKRAPNYTSNLTAIRDENVFIKVDALPADCKGQDSLTNSFSSSNQNNPAALSKKPSNPPTKTVLQFCEPGLRRRNTSDSINLTEDQRQNERLPYTRRFMTNRAGTGLPILSRLVEGERTPGLDADGHPDQLSRFVLPPLPLGLRPPSPEPRSLLLNAPKKRRFRTSSGDSNMFDFSCLNRLLSSYETTSHRKTKRPICRVLRFTE